MILKQSTKAFYLPKNKQGQTDDMAKLTKAAVIELMDEYADLDAQYARAEAAKNKALDPLIEQHNEACKPIFAKFEKKIEPIYQRQAAIEEQVVGYLEQQGKDQQIVSESGAVAEQKTETKVGSRVIDVQRFLEAAKAKGSAMWDCVSVGVAKAIKLLGEEEIDKISEKKEMTTVSRTLRMR